MTAKLQDNNGPQTGDDRDLNFKKMPLCVDQPRLLRGCSKII